MSSQNHSPDRTRPGATSRALPPHPRLDWLKNEAKKRLRLMRESLPADQGPRLAEVQFLLAREYGFPSWRALKSYIDALGDSPVVLLAGDDLCSAANRKDIVRVRQLLQQREKPTQAQLDLALARAISSQRRGESDALPFAIGDLLLEAGANPNGEYGGGYGPIVFAACEGIDLKALDYLLEHGARVDFAPIPTKYGLVSPIFHAAFTYVRGRNVERHQVLKRLVEHGAVYEDDAFFAILSGDHEKLGRFLDASPGLIAQRFSQLKGIGDPDLLGATLLHFAIEFGEQESADLLLSRGADLNAPAESPAVQTPIFHAIRSWRGAHYRLLRHLLEKHAGEIDWEHRAQLSPKSGEAARWVTPIEYAGCSAREVRLMQRFGVAGPIASEAPALPDELRDAFDQICVSGDLDAAHAMLHEHPSLTTGYPLDWIARRCVWHRPHMIELAHMLVDHGTTAELPVLARAGLLDEVIRELEDEPSLLNIPDARGRTALYRATCVYGKFPQGEAVADELIRRGAVVDLWSACTLGMVDRVRELLAKTPSVANAPDAHGMTPLHWACRHRRNREVAHEVVRMLCEAGADVEAVNPMEEGMHPLHHCGEWASTHEVAEVLLEFGAAINAPSESGWTPLDYAIDRGRHSMAHLLVEHGAARSPAQDERGRAFLRAISEAKPGEVPEKLREMVREQPDLARSPAPHPLWSGKTQPLHITIETGHRALFDWLLESGADPDDSGEGYDGWSPLLLALYHRRKAMAQTLLECGARVNLPAALFLGDDERVEQLLSEDPSRLRALMPSLASPLRFATTARSAEYLLAMGAPLEKRDRYGKTPLEAIASQGPEGNIEVVRWMIEQGAKTPAWIYAALGDLPRFKTAARFSPELCHDPKCAFAAVGSGQTAIINWMLEQGLPPDTRSPEGSQGTLLHAAAWEGNLALVRTLVGRGASVEALDEEHRATPAEWAQTALTRLGRSACKEVADWLANSSIDDGV